MATVLCDIDPDIVRHVSIADMEFRGPCKKNTL